MKDTIVMYHKGCVDGIVAAWAAHTTLGDRADYVPYQYGEELPKEAEGKHVIMVDLSIGEELLKEKEHLYKSVLIIDHHKSAIPLTEIMEPVDSYKTYTKMLSLSRHRRFIYFSLDHSGAVLSWQFFNDLGNVPTFRVPHKLTLIQDYDLWHHNFMESKIVHAYMMNERLSIERVYKYMEGDDIPSEVLEIGEALMRYDEGIVKSVLRDYPVRITLPDGAVCAVHNGPHHLRNEICDRLNSEEGSYFSAGYTVRNGKTIVSLRSKGYDVTPIAERHGGGGHKSAAAFAVPNSELQDYVIRSLFIKPTFMDKLKLAWNVLFS